VGGGFFFPLQRVVTLKRQSGKARPFRVLWYGKVKVKPQSHCQIKESDGLPIGGRACRLHHRIHDAQ